MATFGITVTNNWTENLNNVVITDVLVAACSRTNAETAVFIQAIGNLDIVFDIGETFTYNCTDPVVTANYTNTIWVTAVGIGTLTSVNDSDTSAVIIFIPPVIPICTNLTVSQNSGRNTPYNSNYNCTASWPTTFQVTLTDPNGNIIVDTASTSGTFNNINIVWTYTARCFVEWGSTTTPACIKTLNYSTGGGWGGSTSCRTWSFTSSTATCEWSSRARYMRFVCENWKELIKTWNNVSFSITECNDWLDPLIDPIASRMNYTNAKCEASRTSTSWTSRKACEYDPWGGWWGPYCWDGVVQRPNSSWFMEECDSSLWCNNCKLEVITNPWNVNIQINDVNEHYIIGNTMNLYNAHTWLRGPTVKNISSNYDDDYYIPEICAYIKSWNSLEWELICENVGMLYSPEVDWEKNSHYFGWPFNYIGSTTWLANWITQDLNKVAYTLWEGSTRPITWAYFEKTFDVTVVKPTITTTWGWTNYVKNQNAADLKNISNVKDTSGNTIVSNNYVWTWIWDDLSSSSKDGISDSGSLVEGSELEDIVNEKIESITTVDWINYNGMDNVYYVQSDFDITSSFDINTNPVDGLSDTASKTYIIEWSLTINSDITGYPGSLAFIVKGGNIIVWEDVKNLQGTYIALPDTDWYYWNIKGWGNSTNEVLHVKWSMYWDNAHLLSKRTYIKNNSQGQIDVGTIVSFGSSVFRKPAPLTTKFINDYLETTKVAQ